MNLSTEKRMKRMSCSYCKGCYVESDLNILPTIQGATKLIVEIYHKLFTLSKNDFIKALHDLGSIHELRYLKEKLIKDIYTLFAFDEGTVKSMPKSLLKPPDLANAETQSDVVCDLSQTYATRSELETVKLNGLR